MSRRPLFSTYSQGENRVTGSMIAVFERIDLATLTALLADAADDPELQLVSFGLQPASAQGTVPDGEIKSAFRFLFEVKTAYDAVREDQLRGHLVHLSSAGTVDERLFVLSPDADEPSAIGVLRSEGASVAWFSFSRLHSAIDKVADGETIRDDELLLLRELQALLLNEGLLGRQDTVIVAAGSAYGYYLTHHAYVCQQGRAFRRGLTHLGFYRRGQIEREIPKIVEIQDNVLFTQTDAVRRRAEGSEVETRIADVIDASVASGERADGATHKVFLLTPPGDPSGVELAQSLPHTMGGKGSAFTMGQRYVYLEELKTAKSTADLR